MNIDINAEALRVHKANTKWWQDLEGRPIERNIGEFFMLVVSEFSEAMEGDRKNMMDDHIPTRKMHEVEMADALIRCLDFAGGMNIEIIPAGTSDISMPNTKNVGENLLALTDKAIRVVKQYHFDRRTVDYYLSSLIWCIREYCYKFELDLWGAYEDKMAYNAVREDHKLEHRRTEHGKKY